MNQAPFNNRELSWLDFNYRVLEEAEKKSNPVLERLKFLAITASNLDEFFMVRVSYLQDKSKALSDSMDDSGLTAEEQLPLVLEKAKQFQLDQIAILDSLLLKMREKNVNLLAWDELSEGQQQYADNLFYDEIFPVLSPLAVDPARPFPFLSNKSLNLGIKLDSGEDEPFYGVLQLPSILPRFIQLPSNQGWDFLALEDLVVRHLSELFSAYPVLAWGIFRVTRSADFDADDETEDLLEEMIRTLKKRKRGKPIRVEVSHGFDEELWLFLRPLLRVSKKHVQEIPGRLDLAAFFKIASTKGADELRLSPISPIQAADFIGYENMFEAIRQRDRMVHHPYQSFQHVQDFITQAASDPDVLAIKMTLYRVSGQSKVVSALERAAEAGKAVTVLVELKARFDEENNIQWAKRLECAGCHVIYGVTGLKTHCKITLVVRRESSGIRRYVHLGTGNYNDVTSHIYTDIGIFTCDQTFGMDASALFNQLTGFSKGSDFNRLVAAPLGIRSFLERCIDREIENHKNGGSSGIYIKINSLLDGAIIKKLYQASQSGVPVRLLVRGICALVPGVKGYSENITVRSIVGQLLEHSRIYQFENNGNPLVYLGSADLMPRNLDRRIELLFPVSDSVLRQRLLDILELMWQDNTNAREQGNDKIYRPVDKQGKSLNSQKALYRMAKKELKAAQKLVEETLS